MRKSAMGLAALALICSSAASAEGGYWGGTAGLMSVDANTVDDPVNVGLRGGYSFYNGWGFEGEFTDSLLSGEADAFNNDADVDIQTLGAYGTYRSMGDVYFKGRLGMIREEVRVGSFSSTDSGISLGGGIGLNLSPNTNVEFEYTMIEEDVNYWSGSMVLTF